MVKKASKPGKPGASPLTDQVFHLMFENHSAIMLLINPQSGTILDANQAAVDFYGYTRSKLRSMLISEIKILPPEQAELDREKALNEEQNSFVFPHKLASGEIRTVEVHSTAIVLENAQILFSIIHDISERKILEREVEEKQSQFQEVLENSLDAAYKRDLRSNTYEYFSPVITRISGYTPDEMKSMPLETAVGLMHPEDQAEVERVFAELISNTPGSAHQVDYRFKHKDGQYRWFQDQFIVVRDALGQPTALIGSVEDITERKRAEDELRKSQEALQLALAGAEMGMWSLNVKTMAGTMDFRAAKILGYTIEDISNSKMGWDGLTHPDDVAPIGEKLAAHIAGRTPIFESEHRMLHASGEYRWVSGRGKISRFDSDGTPLEISGTILDITDRKLVDEKLHEITGELQGTLDTVTAGISHLKDRKVAWANAAHDEMFGYAPGETRGMETSVFYPDRASFEKLGQAAYPQLLAGKTFNTEGQMRKKDGTPFWCSLNGRLINMEKPEEGAIWMIQDITEHKRADHLLENTRKNYETFFNSIDDFLFVLDGQGQIIHINKTVTDRLGYSEEELFGQSVLVVHPPERREEAGRIVGEMLAGTAEFCPVPVITKSGEQISVETRVTPGFWNDQPAIFGVTKDISQIKLSEEKFSKAFHSNSALMALSRFDDGTYLDVNDVFLNTLGYTRDEVIGRKSTELLLFANQEQRNNLIEKMKQNGRLKDIEIDIQTKTGSKRNGLFSAETIYVGKDECLLTIMVDITERKQAEAALRESENRLRLVADNLPAYVAYVSVPDLRYQFINNNYLNFLQRPRDQIIGQPISSMISQASYEVARPFIDRAMNGEACSYENAFSRGEKHHWVKVTYVPCLDETGKTSGIIILYYDLTDHKAMENALRENEEKIRAIIEFSNDGVMLVNEQGSIIEWNTAYEQITGIPWNEALGQPVWDMQRRFMTRARREQVMADTLKRGILEILETGQSPQLNRSVERQIETASGETRTILHNAFPIKTSDGYRMGVVIHDITERKQAEAALLASEANLKTIFNAADDSIFLLEADGTVTAANAISAERMRLPVEKIIGRKYLDLLPEDVAANRGPMLNRARTSAGSVIFEDDRNGRWMFNQIHPILNAAGSVERLAVFSHDLTERKVMENAYRESEEKHRFLIENSHDIIYTLTAEGVLTFASPAWTALLGHPVTQVIGRSFQEFVHADDLAACLVWLQNAIKTGRRQEGIEYRVQHANGTWYWHTSSAVPLRDKTGTVLGIEGTARDITERKAAEDLLRESEQRFRRLADTVPALIWQAGPDSLFDYFNKGWLEFTGRTLDQEMGTGWMEGIHPDEHQHCLGVYHSAFNLRQTFTMEYRLRHVSGEYRWLLDTGVPRFTEEGIFLGFIGSCVDITNIKRLENELQTQRDFATTIINTMGQGLTVSDAQGRFEFVNLAYARLLGREPANLIGKHPRELTAKEYRALLDEQWAQRLSGKTTTYESLLQRTDGDTVPVVITGVPRKSTGEGIFHGSIAVITDLSGQKRIEDELRNAKDALEQALSREQELSRTDGLTGINNRRHLFELAEQKVAIAARYKQPLAVMMFDIDHFKQVNDVFGHDIGDRILKGIVQSACAELRSGDVIGRYGGEEFIILLPMTIALQAYPLAERIRISVADLGVASDKGNVSVTLSIGIVEMLPDSTESVEDLFRRVDKALYSAKFTGRNRTVIIE